MPRAKQSPISNNAEFEALAKLLDMVVLLLDHDTNLKFASTGAHHLFGSSDSDSLRSDWRDCYDRLNLPDLAKLEKNDKPLNLRTELQLPESMQLLRMDIYPIRHDECDCYLVLVKNLEVLGALEQQLLFASHHHSQRYLISSLVHDLNAPINTMRITLELIERMPLSTVLGESREALAKWDRYRGIFREELNKLKVQVADIPNLFGGALHNLPNSFDLRNLIKEIARVLKHETTAKQIRPEILLPVDPLMVRGRPAELRLALLNLAGSFAEATERGGHFQICAISTEGFAEIIFRGDDVRFDAQVIAGFEQLAFASQESDTRFLVARLIIEAHRGEIQVVTSNDVRQISVRILIPLVH